MKLYHYYQSSAAYRIRIALNYKQIPCELVTVDLSQRAQLTADYQQHNKQGKVPTLEDEGATFGQSVAILEYLEEKYPLPPLLPTDLQARAWVRYLTQIIVSDMHPLMNNSRVIPYLRSNFNLTDAQITQWFHTWLKQGFDALEANLNDKPDRIFCYGDHPTFADACLIPQIYNAHRFNFSMENYPILMRIYTHCCALPYFAEAAPENHQA